jgi:HSP20 family molecular chaperone IbpA
MAEDNTRNASTGQQNAGGTNQQPAQQNQGQQAMQAGGRQKEGQERALLPPVDVVEDANGITLYADLPGVSRENLSLHLETDSLTIEGIVALDVPQDMQSSHADVTLPRYRRVFTLSKELDAEQASAELKNGVLTLRIPKAQHAQPRRIEVKVA